MSSAKTHTRNLMANWVGHGASLVVMFFLSPFIVHTLGKVEYGIWSLLTVLTGYMGVLDLGVRASTGRYIILYLGRGEKETLDQTIRTSLGLYSILGLVVVTVGFAIGWVFPSVFQSVPERYSLVTRILLPVMALNVWFSAIQGVFSSVLVAHDRFDLTRGVDLGVLGVQAGGTVAVLSAGWGLFGLALVMLGCRTLGLAGNYLLSRRIYRPLRTWPLSLHKARLRELFSYGLAAFVSNASLQAIGQMSVVVAGAAIDVAAAAVFSVGGMIVMYSTTFLFHISQTLFPAIQRAVAKGKFADARWLFIRTGRLYVIFGVLAYIGMIAFAEPFIRLWMNGPEFGEESVQQAAMVMRLLAAARLGSVLAGASGSLLNAMGHVKLTAFLAVSEAIICLGLSLVFVFLYDWGVAGIASATMVGRLLAGMPVAWFACSKIGVSWWGYLRRIGGMELLVGALFLGICLLIRQATPVTTWGIFFGQVFGATLAYGGLAAWLLVPRADRRRVWNYVVGRVTPNRIC